ncbi:hypothetical protein GSI_01215 [Ganoderma sinense ZZ0214-1]|uniref:Uncharacterized protein n=1 Tax=Ganoderma sinense ZZ0214-1 TaxID=1077348 RepID=A0A2G8SUR8_9APHY|nr:hypothetical protein GSI_01215 [Ganoderma sinense ZZ0214-1]
MILLEACTDGGRTGCSLSLVSKEIRKRSRAVRFYSVSLLTPSLWKLLRFLHEFGKRRDTAIRGQPPHTMPVVRHLCLLVDIPNELCRDSLDVKRAKQDFLHPDYSLQRRFRNYVLDNSRRRRGWRELPQELALEMLRLEWAYYYAAVMLLEQVAGDLYSLCLYQFPHNRDRRGEGPLQPCVKTFPNLRELWLGGRDGRDASLFLRDTSFPVLRRLHMRADFAPDIMHWLSVAPRLDSLRIVAGPRLLTEEKGRQTLRATAAHPHWREKSKQLTILVPVPRLKRDDPFAWAHFGRCAFELRQELAADPTSPLVFVPCYVAQDVDGCVSKVTEGPGRGRPWPFRIRAWDRRQCSKPVAQDELFRRDWLARIDGWCGGVYVEDFWAHFVGDGEDERKRIEKNIGSYSLPLEGPTYVEPLIIRPESI